ncbi:hypothetical protein CVT24_006107 [Panaeolus cyanescens]|uniref:Zn(2)-C6 fungal-type domain-containing protein n=1 Tax=Panaeolus cyanescens TaxID=181874 RepID=A0A409V8T0_9AGAR|nr:hypothetical protein CVT24_006107 [Panaeolus cyanescens]
MESSSASAPIVKKQEEDDKAEKREIKPVPRTLNRVPRACNACRKQKMRCEGADNPPCKRCRHTGLECLFEKPTREATLTGEAGLEYVVPFLSNLNYCSHHLTHPPFRRIRSLEHHVAEIRQTQNTISQTLKELLHQVSMGALAARSPSAHPSSSFQPSPNLNSPSLSTPTAAHQHASPQSGSGSFTSSHASGSMPPPMRPGRASLPNTAYPTSSLLPGGQPMQQDDVSSQPMAFAPGYNVHGSGSLTTLPPFSTITHGSLSQQNAVSSLRYQANDPNYQRSASGKFTPTGTKRQAPPSNVTSADSSDVEDDDNGELPAYGLVAPWEVLRGLADVAIERAAKENGDASEPHSRGRTPSPERSSRPLKKRRVQPAPPAFPDVVKKGIVTQDQAQQLFKIFYDGCSTFLPVFDSATDTYESLRERSPFAVDTICMVGARVRDGGGKPSEMYLRCLEQVQAISSASLFAPVLRYEAVQSMILVSGWSDNGWLSGGHAVRMAMELSMHKAWPKLYKRICNNKTDIHEDRNLVVASRTWFCLYLFEHQLSYGTGRPAVLKDDESIRDCRALLGHPLTIEDDMRLVSTVELIEIRERVHNALAPFEGPVQEQDFEELRRADLDFQHWYKSWDEIFSQKYEDAAFYRQSLQIQQIHAQLFHNATALRGLNCPEDVQKMPDVQRALAIRSIQIATRGLAITLESAAYREGMRYAVHYTHATATFAASFLLRLARLFPNDCNINEIRTQVERLAEMMANIPGKRYALTLQLMLKRSKIGRTTPSRSPKVSRDSQRSLVMNVDLQNDPNNSVPFASLAQTRNPEPFSPVYGVAPGNYPNHDGQRQHGAYMPINAMNHHQHYGHIPSSNYPEAERILQNLEHTSTDQLPVWISDTSLGGHSFSQHGMDAFIMPPEFLPAAPAPVW